MAGRGLGHGRGQEEASGGRWLGGGWAVAGRRERCRATSVAGRRGRGAGQRARPGGERGAGRRAWPGGGRGDG